MKDSIYIYKCPFYKCPHYSMLHKESCAYCAKDNDF